MAHTATKSSARTPWTFSSVMDELRKLGTEQNIKVYRRHGARGEFFGVSFANLNKLAKSIRRNHALARELWRTRNIDAMSLATLLADPGAVSAEELDEWVREINFTAVASYFVGKIVEKTPFVMERMEAWTQDTAEFTRRCGYELATRLAKSNRAIDGAVFLNLLTRLERDILGSPNRARQTMLNALIAIGERNEQLRLAALSAAQRIGPVPIDHGETGCKTPDAVKTLTIPAES